MHQLAVHSSFTAESLNLYVIVEHMPVQYFNCHIPSQIVIPCMINHAHPTLTDAGNQVIWPKPRLLLSIVQNLTAGQAKRLIRWEEGSTIWTVHRVIVDYDESEFKFCFCNG